MIIIVILHNKRHTGVNWPYIISTIRFWERAYTEKKKRERTLKQVVVATGDRCLYALCVQSTILVS